MKRLAQTLIIVGGPHKETIRQINLNGVNQVTGLPENNIIIRPDGKHGLLLCGRDHGILQQGDKDKKITPKGIVFIHRDVARNHNLRVLGNSDTPIVSVKGEIKLFP